MEIFSNKRILVCVAHPDDELLGIGGTIHKLVKNNIIKVAILGEGITSRSRDRDTKKWQEELEIHKNNIKLAQEALGYQASAVYDFPDNRFDSVALLDIIKVVEKELSEFNPDIIFTHHGGDLNIDHQKTFEAVMTSCRPMKSRKVTSILTFETPSSTEWIASTEPRSFIPNFFIEINEANLTAKIKAMECYEFEKRAYPHPRSPEALRIIAQNRGLSVGLDFAEAFMMVRQIERIN